tara:strand:- start:17577 stop:17933 length:357 start_codon:yes stop_codon:yes gene_type:complete
MKYIIITLIFLASCNHTQKQIHKTQETPQIPPNLPPHVIEINSVPHPFNLNGGNPYVVWVNGQRVNLTLNQKKDLINIIKAENIKPVSEEDLHSGDGWLNPLYPSRKSFELVLHDLDR